MTDVEQQDSSASITQKSMPEDGLGSRVKIVRDQLGITHDGLSNLTKIADVEGRGISRTTIRGYELGTYKPGARELRILSLALKVSPSWLLFGEESESQPVKYGQTQPGKSGRRWANIVFPLIAFSQLGGNEKQQIASLIETLYRLQKGEVAFRSEKAFVEDMADTLQDHYRDRTEFANFSQEEARAVFFDTLDQMKKKHGEAQAELLKATFELFVQDWLPK